MAKTKRTSFQSIIKKRQHREFVGRTEQLDGFRRNLRLPYDDEQRLFLYNIWGQGGVGKTTLLRRFLNIAEGAGCVSALTDEAEADIPSVMSRLIRQFQEQGYECSHFAKRYAVYQQKREELEADPDAPLGLTAFAASTVVKTGIRLARRAPGAGIAFDFVDEDVVASHAGEWAEYVRRRLGNKDEVQLLLEPEATLTPLFLQGIEGIAEDKTLVLLFDTYEQQASLLDGWLRDMLDGRYGNFPPNFVMVISGREPFDPNYWSAYTSVLERFPLDPFTEREAREYLTLKGIDNEEVVQVILQLSGRLPLLIATLAMESPDDPEQIGDITGTAVERFLKWVDDPEQRKIALNAALPRHFNQDILTLLSPDDGQSLFDWLKKMPFVIKHAGNRGWVYHDVVRTQMLRYQRNESPKIWTELQGILSAYFKEQQDSLGLNAKEGAQNEEWQAATLAALYHTLCQSAQGEITFALGQFLIALDTHHAFAKKWAATMTEAGVDVGHDELERWGKQLSRGLQDPKDGRYEPVLELFSALSTVSGLEPLQKAIAISRWSMANIMMGRYKEASVGFTRAIELNPDDRTTIRTRGLIYNLLERHDEALTDFTRIIELDAEDTWAIVQRGEIYLEMERYDEALADFMRAIELNPDDEEAIIQRGKFYQQMERYDEALADFMRVIELNPDDKEAIIQRGKFYQQMERYDEALADFMRVIELNPDDKEAIIQRGKFYQQMERYDEALADFMWAIELNPDDEEAIIQRGKFYQQTERYDEALADFTRVIELKPKGRLTNLYISSAIASRASIYLEVERYEEALADFARVIKLNPDDKEAVALRGGIHLDMERYEEALADFTRAIELDGEYVLAIRQRGNTYLQTERYDEALADFMRIIELNSDDKKAIVRQGVTYLQMERHDEALVDFTRAIELDEDNEEAIAQRGETYLQMERYEEALADFTRAIELDAEYAFSIAQRGVTYLQAERYEKALADFTRAIELDAEYAFIIVQRGATYLQMERDEEALVDFTRAIELDADYYGAIALRGETYLQMGYYEEALVDFTRAIELDAEYALVIRQRGMTYLQMGCYEEALADFTRAIELDAEEDWSCYSRGLTYLVMGKYERSKDDFRQAISLATAAYEIDPEDWSNTFNMALYYLVTGDKKNAESLYHEGSGVSEKIIREAIADLNKLLHFFPDHVQALDMRTFLQGCLDS